MTNKINARGKKRRDKKAILQMVCEDEIGEIGIEEKWRDRGGRWGTTGDSGGIGWRPTGRPCFVVSIPHKAASTPPVATVLHQMHQRLGVHAARRSSV